MGRGNVVVVVEWDSIIGTHVEGLADGMLASHVLKNKPLENELSDTLALAGLMGEDVDGERGGNDEEHKTLGGAATQLSCETLWNY